MADALQVINGQLQRLEVYMKQLLEAAQYDRSEMHVNELLRDEVHESLLARVEITNNTDDRFALSREFVSALYDEYKRGWTSTNAKFATLPEFKQLVSAFFKDKGLLNGRCNIKNPTTNTWTSVKNVVMGAKVKSEFDDDEPAELAIDL
jgi:hypothetical protein